MLFPQIIQEKIRLQLCRKQNNIVCFLTWSHTPCRWAGLSANRAITWHTFYVPTTAIVSLLYITEDGASVEIAVVGNEGSCSDRVVCVFDNDG